LKEIEENQFKLYTKESRAKPKKKGKTKKERFKEERKNKTSEKKEG
jgi:hypothetical protein